jgi:hypothetical protein
VNPLLLKIGLPAIVFAAIAFMKWTNAKATGSPVFPGLGTDENRKGKGGGGGSSIIAPDPDKPGGITPVESVGSTTGGDSASTSDIGTNYATNDTSISSVRSSPVYARAARAVGIGGDGGGYQTNALIQQAQQQQIASRSIDFAPALTPYGGSRPTITPAPITGGGGGAGKTFAI